MRRLSRASCAVMALLAQASGVIAQPAPNDAATVSDVQVRAPEQVLVPEVGIGAPLLTIGELEVIQMEARRQAQEAMSSAQVCKQDRIAPNPGNFLVEYDAAVAARGAADQAIEATRLAEQVRRDAVQGARTRKEVEDAELARQAVIRRMVAARAAFLEAQAVTADLQKLEQERPKMFEHGQPPKQLRPPPPVFGQGTVLDVRNTVLTSGVRPPLDTPKPSPGAYPTPEEWVLRHKPYLTARAHERQYASGQPARPLPPQFADLKLENLEVVDGEDRQGRFLRVSGAIRNPRRTAIPTPPLSITVLDRFGFPLKTELADPPGNGRIRAGQTQAFRYQVRPTPGATHNVLVTFGSDEYEPWRLPLNATDECPVLPFTMPKPAEGALPSPRDLPATALRSRR